jgi:hypothetical protein
VYTFLLLKIQTSESRTEEVEDMIYNLTLLLPFPLTLLYRIFFGRILVYSVEWIYWLWLLFMQPMALVAMVEKYFLETYLNFGFLEIFVAMLAVSVVLHVLFVLFVFIRE